MLCMSPGFSILERKNNERIYSNKKNNCLYNGGCNACAHAGIMR